MKPEPILYGDRKVYTVSAFNRGVASWLERLPTLWVEGEVTDLRRQPGWQTVFFTLKDPADGSCLGVKMLSGRVGAQRLDLRGMLLEADDADAEAHPAPVELGAAQEKARALRFARVKGRPDTEAALVTSLDPIEAAGKVGLDRRLPHVRHMC